MPMRIGEMMVVVRAQDFASRTLHKVSGELNAMSRQQAMAYRGADLARQQRFARQTLANAKSNVEDLRTIQARNRALERVARVERRILGQQQIMTRLRMSRRMGIRTAEEELRLAQKQLDTARRLREIYPRSSISPAQRAAEVQAARRRVSAAEAGVASARAVPKLSPALADATTRMGRLQNLFKGATHEVERLNTAIGEMHPRMRGAANSTQVLNDQLNTARTRLAQAYTGLTKAQQAQMEYDRALRQMPIQKLHDLGHALTGIGRTMQLFGAIGTVAFGVSANAAANFNREVMLAATQTRQAGQSFKATAVNADILQNSILKLMQEFPASAEEMSQAAYDIFSSIDVTFGGGQKLLREFNKVAVAGGVDLVTATNAGISVLENFDTKLVATGKVTSDTHDILNRMFAIVRFGRMNFAQFNDMLNSVVPAATGAQQSFDDVAGAMAFLTRRIPSQSRAATALARLLDVFTNKDFQVGMAKAGVAITDVNHRLVPLPEIIDKIAATNPKQLNEVIRVFTAVGRGQGRGREFTVQARRALTQMISGIEEYRVVQKSVVSDNDEFVNSFRAMSETLGVKWQVFLNQLKVLVLYIGESALPAFVQIGETIQSWIRHWQNLSQSSRDLIVRIGVFASVATLLGGILLAVVGTVVGLSASLAGLSTKFGGAGVSSGLLGQLGKFLFTMRGLASLGSIGIGIKLIQEGGNWAKLGTVLAAAGLGGLVGGRRGFAGGGVIGIGLLLKKQGGGWNSMIGNILMAAGTGFAMGGLAGAAVATTIAVVVQIEDKYGGKGKFLKQIDEFQKQRDSMMGRGMFDAVNKANHILATVAAKGGRDAGVAAALAYLNAFEEKGFKKMFANMRQNINQALGIVDEIQPDRKLTLRNALRSAKSFTEMMKLANEQVENVAGNMEKVAINIGRAMARGNLGDAAALLNKFVNQANKELTPQNILGEIDKAIASGDMQAVTDLIQNYAQASQQAAEDAKQYQEDMVRRQADLQRTIRETTSSTMDALMGLYTSLQQANEQAFGQLFKGPILSGESFDLAKEWGVTASIQDMINDITAQSNQFAQRRKMLDTLFKRGLPKGFLDELKAMTPEEAMPILKELVSSTPKETQRLVRALNRRGTQIKNATKLDFSREINSFRAAGMSMGEAIKNGFQQAQVGPWFASWINQKFPGIINQAINMAVNDYKNNNPMPEKPPAFGPVQGTNKTPGAKTKTPTTTTTNGNVTYDNSINIQIQSHGIGITRAEAKRIAFLIANKVYRQRIISGGGRLPGSGGPHHPGGG